MAAILYSTVVAALAIVVGVYIFFITRSGPAANESSTTPPVVDVSEQPTPVVPDSSEQPQDPNAPLPRMKKAKRKKPRIFSVEELAQHNGSDRRKPLLLAILGEVYDVGTGEVHYGLDGGYKLMGARDCSKCFSAGVSDGEEATSSLEGLEPSDVAEVMRWRDDFYRKHETYRFVGLLNERYYNEKGEPSAEIKRLERLQTAAKAKDGEREALDKRFMGCNSRHEADKSTIELWCDDSYHPVGSKPLHLHYSLPSSLEGDPPEKGDRCACVNSASRKEAESEAQQWSGNDGRPMPGKTIFRLVDYTDCKEPGQRCERPKDAKPPRADL